jgi:CheY-like chemotaxis protein
MASKPQPATTAEAGAFRVLIVSSEGPDRDFLDRVLRQRGYKTAVVADAFDAIKTAETRGPFDLLVTDVIIPGIRGDELARRLRRTDPELKILYVADNSDPLFEERTALWQEESFLDKPVTVPGLLEAVSLALVGSIPAPRAVRVHVPGARVRFADGVADLVRLSETGTLMNSEMELTVGSLWRLTLELPSETIRVTGRVVSCAAQVAVMPGGAPRDTSHAIALAFVRPSASARRALRRVVHEASMKSRV